MKKLYRKSTVQPTPSVVSEHLLSFLPAAVLTLAAALSPEDREVLAYLISCSSASFFKIQRGGNRKSANFSSGGGGGSSKGGDDHEPCFNCNCFRCYMSYWVKWDSSPNRQLIHEIIDAFEDSLSKESKRESNRRERRKGKIVKVNRIGLGELDEPKGSGTMAVTKKVPKFGESNPAANDVSGNTGGGGGFDKEDGMGKGSIRRFVGFLGERIWRAWG